MRRLEDDNRRLLTQNHAYSHDLEELRNEVIKQKRRGGRNQKLEKLRQETSRNLQSIFVEIFFLKIL